MKTIALTNLGSHDLISRKRRERILPIEVQELVTRPDEWQDLIFPILVPLLTEVKKRNNDHPPCLVFFVTDQGDQANSKHRNQDTVFLGQLIKNAANNDGLPVLAGLTDGVFLASPITFAPHDYDAMLSWYRENLNLSLKKAVGSTPIKLDNPLRLHISITGGTPAMNMALLFAAFGSGMGRVEDVWHVNDQTRQAHQLQVGHVLAGEPLRQTLNAHMDRGDWEGAAELAAFLTPAYLEKSLRAMADLRRGAFKEAQHRINNRSSIYSWTKRLSAGAEKMRERKFTDNYRPITIDNDIRAIHAYLLNEMKLQFGRKDYPEAMGALYRLQESLVRIVFEQITGIQSSLKKPTDKEKWIKKTATFLTDSDIDDLGKIQFSRQFQAKVIKKLKPDHPLSRWLIRYYGKRQPNLAALRNKSRLAHGFMEVTESSFKRAGFDNGPIDIIQMVENVITEILGRLPEPPDEKVKQRIMKTIQS